MKFFGILYRKSSFDDKVLFIILFARTETELIAVTPLAINLKSLISVGYNFRWQI